MTKRDCYGNEKCTTLNRLTVKFKPKTKLVDLKLSFVFDIFLSTTELYAIASMERNSTVRYEILDCINNCYILRPAINYKEDQCI